MIRLLADENLNNDIVRGLVRRVQGVDLQRVQDIGLRGADDDAVLEHAARDGRIVLTHDVSTLVARAYERLAKGESMPGVIAIPQDVPVGAVVADLVLVVECSSSEEWSGQVRYLPLR